MVAANTLDREIFWQLRFPRVLVAFFAGSGLALCGMVFQAVFRNPLADPLHSGQQAALPATAVTILAGLGGSFLGVP